MNRHYFLRSLFTACLGLAGLCLKAQEFEFPLRFNAQANERFQREQRFDANNQRGGSSSLLLPFLDDFSRYSLATSDPEIPTEWQRWSDNAAYINCTFPINPMTIGV
ncbi:MAG: hypothetical protein ACOVQM_15665, partial [Pirellula sp.]